MSDNTPLPGPTALMTINTVLIALTSVSATEAKMAEAMIKMAADVPKHPAHCQRELRRMASVLRESSEALHELLSASQNVVAYLKEQDQEA